MAADTGLLKHAATLDFDQRAFPGYRHMTTKADAKTFRAAADSEAKACKTLVFKRPVVLEVADLPQKQHVVVPQLQKEEKKEEEAKKETKKVKAKKRKKAAETAAVAAAAAAAAAPRCAMVAKSVGVSESTKVGKKITNGGKRRKRNNDHEDTTSTARPHSAITQASGSVASPTPDPITCSVCHITYERAHEATHQQGKRHRRAMQAQKHQSII